MTSRNLGPASQRFHIRSCRRFAAWLQRSPGTATPDDVKIVQRNLIESGVSTCNQFLFRVTLRRHDLAAEALHLQEPKRVPRVLSQQEIKRLLVLAPSLWTRTMLSIAYGCGLRAGEVTRLWVGDIVPEARLRHDDSDQGSILECPHRSGPPTGIGLSRMQEDQEMAGKRDKPEELSLVAPLVRESG